MVRVAAVLLLTLVSSSLAACASLSAQNSVADVFQDVNGAVVTLHTAASKLIPNNQGRMTSVSGMGSGAIIDSDGTILTAAHVVQTADAVVVEFPDGHKQEARVISSVVGADLALVRLVGPLPSGVRPLTLADSDSLGVGEQVLVIGAPLGQTHSLSVGHVSARRSKAAFLPMDRPIEFIQTDASINQGNSGGPMLDMRGRVVGVVSHIMSQTGGSEGLGYAVSSNVAKDLLLDGGSFWSGADVVPVGGVLAAALNLPDGRGGLLVQAVAKSSPAADMGLRAGTISAEVEGQPLVLGGDIVLEVAGLRVDSADFFGRVRQEVDLGAGKVITLKILRGGQIVDLEHRMVAPRG
jgi:S1-C subfamily serine protease